METELRRVDRTRNTTKAAAGLESRVKKEEERSRDVKLFVFKWLESCKVEAVKRVAGVRGAGFSRKWAGGCWLLRLQRAGRPGGRGGHTRPAASPAFSRTQWEFAASTSEKTNE